MALPPPHVAIFWFTASPQGGGLIIRNYVTAGNAPRLNRQTDQSDTYEILMDVPVREYMYMLYAGVAHTFTCILGVLSISLMYVYVYANVTHPYNKFLNFGLLPSRTTCPDLFLTAVSKTDHKQRDYLPTCVYRSNVLYSIEVVLSAI